MLTRPDVVLFDMGGVLLESADMWTEPGFHKSFPGGLPDGVETEWFMRMSSDILDRYNALRSPKPVMDCRPLIQKWLPEAHIDPTPQAIEDWYAILGWWEVRPLYPFVRDTLSRIRKMGYRIGLISNTLIASNYHRNLFRDGRIYELFECMVFSAEFGVNKPDPRIFRHVLDKMHTAPERAWYIGDKPHRDVCGARGVGMTSVLVDGPYEDRMNDGPDHIPHLRIRDIGELPKILASL